MKKFGIVLILLLMLQVLLGVCGDDDHTDKWVGRWTLEMWNGENHAESLETSFKLSFLKAGGSVEEWDLYYHGYDSNKLQFTMSNLSNNIQNIEASRSSIEDADFAAEAADLAKNQILAQSATAMLVQASAISQNILSLLR